jgi:hypothetical protein
MKRRNRLAISLAAAILVGGSLISYEVATIMSPGGSISGGIISTFLTTGFVTGTGATRFASFTNNCVVSTGGFEFRVVSDSTGRPVSGETINAVDKMPCQNNNGVFYVDNFSEGQEGWLMPIAPPYVIQGGGYVSGRLNFTVTYQGRSYNFTAGPPPIGTNCVTLHIPSGTVTSSTVMNGYGSYCY